MSTKTNIANLVAVRIGLAIFTDVDVDATVPANEFNAVWNAVLEEALELGPEEGWEFARWHVSDVDVDNSAITAFADGGSGTVDASSTAHQLVVGDLVTIKDGSIGAYDGDHTVTVIDDANTFTFVDTFTATETATAQWTSKRRRFRYARPTSIRVTEVYDEGVPVPDWTRKENWIFTDLVEDDVEMDYIRAVADLTITNFPPHFIEVMWRKMAIHMLYTRTQNQKLQDRLTEEIEEVYLPRAIGMDAREQFVHEQDQSWVLAGRGGRNNDFNLPNLKFNTGFGRFPFLR